MGLRLATYRLQLRPGFDFREAQEVLPYLHDLGVSHVYCSPCFQAAPGSTHGYDVVDPGRISGDLGGEDAYAAFCARLRELGLQQILDIVPNHMCVSDRSNWRWWDVLEDGRASPWAETFDIDWEQSPRVVLPVLGDTLDAVLARGELHLEGADGDVLVRYFDSVFPLALTSIVDTLAAIPRFTTVARHVAQLDEVRDQASRLRRREQRETIHQGLQRAMSAPDGARLFGELAGNLTHGLLDRQHYRLASWREAATSINYRRFFDINSLAGVRVEEPRVFDDTQRLAVGLAQSATVDGLRIDHVDGLRLPHRYLQELRAHTGEHAWLLVEKILDRGEPLPPEWPVQGTTGYEFAAVAGGLFVDPAGRDLLTEFASEFTGETQDAGAVIGACKRLVCERVFVGDIARLARRLRATCERYPEHAARSERECVAAVTAMLIAMPVYRTYSEGHGPTLSEQDIGVLQTALEQAQAFHDGDPSLLHLIATLVGGGAQTDEEVDFVLRLQQTGAAVTAKGMEDTAFYRCVSLLSLDEVGDGPSHRGTSSAEFHRHNLQTAQQHPFTLLATTTHDTKRSEDVRMRLHVLSEFAELWADRVRRWSAHNERHKHGGPDATDEVILYQTLVGAHPLDAERAVAYMQKAVREAKRRTSWTDPDPAYDRALESFARDVVADPWVARELAEFTSPLLTLGRVNSLALTLLKVASPGVPDIYQGCELWDLSLVDPDNRRPVDYPLRRTLLHSVLDGPVGWAGVCGEAKLSLIARALALRRRRAESFGPARAYQVLEASGENADHVVAFQRGADVIAVVPRLVGSLSGWSADYAPAWGDTALELPSGTWHDVLSEGAHAGVARMSELLGAWPVALLERSG